MEVELMVTKRDDDLQQLGKYRAICLGKVGRQSFAIQIQRQRKEKTSKKKGFMYKGIVTLCCTTSALLLDYFCTTSALLLQYFCTTSTLLLLYFCTTWDTSEFCTVYYV